MSDATTVPPRRDEDTLRILHLRSILWNKITFDVAWKRTIGLSAAGQELSLKEEAHNNITDPMSIRVSCGNLVQNRNTIWETKHRVHQLGLIIYGGKRNVGCLETLWRIQQHDIEYHFKHSRHLLHLILCSMWLMLSTKEDQDTLSRGTGNQPRPPQAIKRIRTSFRSAGRTSALQSAVRS